ncbi:hydantoinase B/oxoprolinase family protein [Ignicoccus hospitalis]|uniref:5-oxoprolinase (ATP-hydrolyzing) n=1 Tax=Ignicoccus hospitalis (strain KIN4/I / DSM 18386 / JCM 14125) TaxID=453591 RepID=A8A973_IGNH4|nr:hydantoinase B/oxoprolinase family protein [Ignicoccus hospitalis]ABU81475.1 5-oxoprolinase (ATP-hydrolyzing) [Ignicoccus hospitalis KIN4/I]HIH90217.1 hydantoinase B/oxoprolinase family protein [Desulfurococcaceae archaeon]
MKLRAGVVQRALSYIAEEMGSVLKRSSVSPNIRERLDMSCALLDEDGRVLAQAEHIPVHLGSLSWAAPRLVERASELVEDEGDVMIVNDPYLTGTHLNDVTVMTKYKNVWIVNKAHHVDVGGPVPGSLNPNAKTLFEEGIVIEPALVAKRWRVLKVAEDLAKGVRGPKTFLADLKAQIAALRTGLQRLRELEDRYGDINEYKEDFLEASKRAYSERLAEVSGEGEAEVPLELPEGLAKIRVRLKVGEVVEADFSGSSDQVPYNLNAVEGIAYAAVAFFVKAMTVPEGPVDHGLYSLIKVKTREGSLLNPRFPAAVGAGNLETSQRALEAVVLAAQGFSHAPSGGPGTMSNLILSWGNKVYYETNAGGGSATKDSDGQNAVQWGMTNTMNTPIEIIEREAPVLFTRYSVRRGSGGAGTHKGGDGVVREFIALDDLKVTVIMSRYLTKSPGAKGGSDGEPGAVLVDGEPVEGYFSGELKKGSRLTLMTPGAGGWGRA